jgi:hypothetical protein
MKKITLLLLLFISVIASAQEKEPKYPQDVNKNYELKINTTSLIVLSSLDVSYEKIINRDSSFGVAVFYNFDDINNDFYFPKKFSLTPYYRWFFSDTRYARGFFVEGFGMLSSYKDYDGYFYSNYDNNDDIINETSFSLGVSIGGKFVLKGGFIAEVYFGLGRSINNSNSEILNTGIITRGGVSIGYRF